jgi:hypothetical protein
MAPSEYDESDRCKRRRLIGKIGQGNPAGLFLFPGAKGPLGKPGVRQHSVDKLV